MQNLSEACDGLVHIQNWWMNSLQPINQNLFEDFIVTSEPWSLIGIPCRDTVLGKTHCELRSAHEEIDATS